MTHRKSTDYVLPSSEAESERLEQQAALYGGVEFLEPFVAERPGTVLDVCCGTGFFSVHVARALPESRVVGLDLDESRLAFARARSRGLANLRYEHGTDTAMGFDDGVFELVFSRFAMVHAADPDAVLAEMRRVTAPGGRVVCYDMIHDGIWFSPDKPAFAALLREVITAMRGLGMEPNQGLHLGQAMRRVGLVDVEVCVWPHHFADTDPLFEVYRRNWVETVSGIDEILGARFDRDLVGRALDELADQRPHQSLLELTVLASAKKPLPTAVVVGGSPSG